MRIPLLFLLCEWIVGAQSHPTWWNHASAGSTALVGIEWQSVRQSPFAEAVESELWGDLGFPNLACLYRARQIVLSSPDMLAMAATNCQAFPGFEAMTYRGVDMYFSKEQGVLSVAKLSDQLVLLGEPKTLQLAVDRSLSTLKEYSPLLARAAQFNGKDLWVVASRLPDQLANRFVPLEIQAQGFEGSVSVRNGLELRAIVTAASEREAEVSAAKLRQDSSIFPSIARGLAVTTERDSIVMTLSNTREQVLASMKGAETPVSIEKPVETVKVETPKHVQFVAVELPKPAQIVVAVVEKVVVPEKPIEKPVEKPQIVRIVGLDEGPKEFVLPKAPTQQP